VAERTAGDRRSRLSLIAFLAASLTALHAPVGPARATETMTFSAQADATVAESDRTENFGGERVLEADQSPLVLAYLRFNVSDLSGRVRRATLRLWVVSSAHPGPVAHATSASWEERKLTWSNRPAASQRVAELARVETHSWAEYDVTAAVGKEGPVAFVLTPRSSGGAEFASRQAGDHRPALVVETEADPPTTTTTTRPSTTTTRATTTTTTRPSTTTTRAATTTTTRPSTTTTRASTTTTRASTTTTRASTTTTRAITTTTRPTTTTTAGSACGPRWETARKFSTLPASASEASGLVASQKHRGWGWMIRDSGHPASLYSLHLDGGAATVHEFPVPGANNRDWEEVAYTTGAGGRGVLWILDNMGNDWSGNRRIYQVEEPDPRTGGPAKLLGTYEFAYPDTQWNSEILFGFDGDLVLIAKTSPRMYRFTGPLSPGKVNVPEFIGTLPETEAPTLAGVSPDRRFLIVGSYVSVWVFENRGARSDLRSLIARPPVQRQSLTWEEREGGTFFPTGSCDFVMVAESGNVWKLADGD
jgi:hypothetical protein